MMGFAPLNPSYLLADRGGRADHWVAAHRAGMGDGCSNDAYAARLLPASPAQAARRHGRRAGTRFPRNHRRFARDVDDLTHGLAENALAPI
jgi:hypothetical protein